MTINNNILLLKKKVTYFNNLNNYILTNNQKKKKKKILILINNLQKNLNIIFSGRIISKKKLTQNFNFNKMFKNSILKNKKYKIFYKYLKKNKLIKHNTKSRKNNIIKNYIWSIWKTKNNIFPFFWNYKNIFFFKKKKNILKKILKFKIKNKKIEKFLTNMITNKIFKKHFKKIKNAKKKIKLFFQEKKKEIFLLLIQKILIYHKIIFILKKKKTNIPELLKKEQVINIKIKYNSKIKTIKNKKIQFFFYKKLYQKKNTFFLDKIKKNFKPRKLNSFFKKKGKQKPIWFFLNFKMNPPQKKNLLYILYNIEETIDSVDTRTSNSMLYKQQKKKINLVNYKLKNYNKNFLIFINLIKNRTNSIKKNNSKYKYDPYLILMKKLKQFKVLAKTNKKINSSIINLNITNYFFKLFNISIFVKTIINFNISYKNINKLFIILKKKNTLKKYINRKIFLNSMFSGLASIYYKKPQILLLNLSKNLKKERKHRQLLFHYYFLLMNLLWSYDLKKTSSNTNIKTFFITIHGKINSGTRSKTFFIKATHKPSMLTFKNHLNFNKEQSNAKTGSFGLQGWMHF